MAELNSLKEAEYQKQEKAKVILSRRKGQGQWQEKKQEEKARVS
jgi:hypothetical protein